MFNENIDIFEFSYGESVFSFKHLKNLEKIKHINGPVPATLKIDDKKRVSVISIVSPRTTTTRLIAE
jgi:hypothetical protein